MASAMEIEEQAAKWLIALDAQGSPEDWTRVSQWLAASPRHRAAFLRLSKAWNRSDALRKFRPLDCRVDVDLLAPAPTPHRFGWRGIGLAIASTVVVAVCAALVWQLSPRFMAPVYETSFAATERVVLPDGSRMQLNSDSRARIEFTPSLRNLVLERGEAVFEVSPDVRRPFQVSAGSTRAVSAQGHFSVRLKSPELVDVLVAAGQVVFERARSPLDFASSGARFTRTLLTGDVASAGRGGVMVRNIGGPAVHRRMAWVNGQVWFLGETLAEAVREINRYNREPLVIQDPAIASRRISGTFDATDTRTFVHSLEKPLHVRAVRERSGGRTAAIRLESTQR